VISPDGLIPNGYGIPVSVEQDRHNTPKGNDNLSSLDEQLRGRQHVTQVGWSFDELAIRVILNSQDK
jgi:hypothetical protein